MDLADLDSWSAILLKVDPDSIFKCILVSKEWLQIITNSNFRRSYLNKWNNRFKVIGFLEKDGWFPMVATNKIGDHVNKTKLSKEGEHVGRFISKSSSGDGLVLCQIDRTFCVFNLATRDVIVTPLPPPPVRFPAYNVTIISSHHDDSFKVIMVNTDLSLETDGRKTLGIQTFSSSTLKWKFSELTWPDHRCEITGDTGFGSIKVEGMLYFPTRELLENGSQYNHHLASYDTNYINQAKAVRLILGPVADEIKTTTFDVVSPQGHLWCATTKICGITNLITIWIRDDNGDDGWKVSYMIDTLWICKLGDRSNNSPFQIVSINPGKSDSIFVAWKKVKKKERGVFIFHMDGQRLERFPATFPDEGEHFVPLTTTELGFWPSYSPEIKKKAGGSFKRLYASLVHYMQ